MRKIWPVILAGGDGEDLWPLSRRLQPKAFLDVTGGGSLFRHTCQRLQRSGLHPPLVVAGTLAAARVREELLQLGLLGRARVILEPAARGMGMAALAAAFVIASREPRSLLLVSPCDQMVRDENRFHELLQAARPAAEAGAAVLLAPPLESVGGVRRAVFVVDDGERKNGPLPVRRLAGGVSAEGGGRKGQPRKGERALWNSGTVLVRADRLLARVRQRMPQVYAHMVQTMGHAWQDGIVVRPSALHWQRLPTMGLVPGIYGADGELLCQPADCGWEEVGDWAGLHHYLPHDERGNAAFGPALMAEAEDSLVWNAGGPLVALAGLKDVIAVSTADAVLVCAAEHADAAANFAARLARAGRPEAEQPVVTTHPWGRSQRLVHGGRYRLELLHVRPQGAISLRRHGHDLLVWLVISGRVDVVAGDRMTSLGAGESLAIPRHMLHRLDNPGPMEAVVLELRLNGMGEGAGSGQETGRRDDQSP